MSTIILEMGHDYLRVGVCKDGAASFVSDQFGGDKFPTALFFSSVGCSLGYNTKTLLRTVKINHICDSDVLLSSCAAQVDKKIISGKDVAENLLRGITDAARAYLCECIDTVICIVPNHYGRARYLLADAAKKLGIGIRFIKATDCTAYAHVAAIPESSSDGEALIHTIHFGYCSIDRAIHEFESNVLEARQIVSKDTDYVDAFIDRLAAYMLSAVFETGLLVDESEYRTILENVKTEAKIIGTMKRDRFPHSLTLKKILGYSVKEPVDITFSWDDMLSYARQASKDVLPSVKSIVEELVLPNTVVVSGEGIGYPALRSILFDMIREEGFEPILCEEAILELAKYYNTHTGKLILSNAGVALEMKTAHDTTMLVQEWQTIPARSSQEIRTWGKKQIGIVLIQGGEPVLWGVIPTERISAITLEVEIDHSELLEATVQVGSKTFSLQHEGMTALDAFLILPTDNPLADIPLREVPDYLNKRGIEYDKFDLDEPDDEDPLDDMDSAPTIMQPREEHMEEDENRFQPRCKEDLSTGQNNQVGNDTDEP